MAIFYYFLPIPYHLYLLQVENCDSNSRLVVDEDDNGKFRLQRVKPVSQQIISHNLELNIAFKYRIAIQLILNHLEVVMRGGEKQIQMGYNFN